MTCKCRKLKNYRHKWMLFVLFSFFLFTRELLSVDIGSDTVVNKFTSQQILNNGDRIAGSSCLLSGFMLKNSLVSAIFDSNFPVIGDIALEGGLLSLNRDLILRDVSAIQTLGSIVGNKHVLEISSSVQRFPETQAENSTCGYESCDISYVTNINASYDILSCDWSFDDNFIVVALEGDESKNLKIYEFDGSILTLKDSEQIGEESSVNSVSWHPSDYLFAVGANAGNELSVYQVNANTGALTKKMGINMSDVNAVDWHPSGNWIAVGEENSSREVAIYAVDSQGNINAIPVSVYNTSDNVEKNALRWNSDGSYLVAGLDSNSTAEILVFAFDQETETITLDVSLNESYSVHAVAWSNVFPNFLAVGLYTNSGEMLKVYEFDSVDHTLVQRAAKSDIGDYVWSLDWHPNSNCLALGRDGKTGYDFRIYYFDSSDYSLNQITGYELGNNDVRCVKWSHSGSYVTQGCDNNNLYVYSAPSCASSVASSIEFTDLHISLCGNIALDNSQIIFKGESVIDGNGNIFDLSGTSTIIIDSNASLCLKDISLKGMLNSNIYCTDHTSTLLVDNCRWLMEVDYDFNAGHLDILHDFEIIGSGYNFSYKTDQRSTILANSRLILHDGVTFSYIPTLADKNLIDLFNSTSDIILRGATLFCSSIGLRLTKGNLIVERKSFLECDGSNYAEAICFGDGASADNDLHIETIGAANLEVSSGYVVYDNISG